MNTLANVKPTAYRFIRFKMEVTLRVPWESGADPGTVAENFREALFVHFTNADADFQKDNGVYDGNVWNQERLSPPRTFDYASDLDKRWRR